MRVLFKNICKYSLDLIIYVAGYFWHITDIHYDPRYSAQGNSFNSEFEVIIIRIFINCALINVIINGDLVEIAKCGISL